MERLFDFVDTMLVVLAVLFGLALLKVSFIIWCDHGGVFAVWVTFVMAMLALCCVVVRIVQWVVMPL